ncbi:putative hypothetical protein [Clostridium botulinum BKT015925]|nr:putative hypothetical protein [Clostridium botulinum BKT015925]
MVRVEKNHNIIQSNKIQVSKLKVLFNYGKRCIIIVLFIVNV